MVKTGQRTVDAELLSEKNWMERGKITSFYTSKTKHA